MSFNEELKQILESHRSDTQAVMLGEAIQSPEEQLAIAELVALAPHYNMKCDGLVDDGVIEFSTKTKLAVEHFCTKLDTIDNVYTYELAVIVKDPVTGADTEQTDDLEFDNMMDSQYITFVISVYLNPEIVAYDPVYVDVDGGENGDNEYDYDDDYMYMGESTVQSQDLKTLPFFVNICKSKTKVTGGKISCSVLRDKNLISVFVQYPKGTDIEANRESILDDIDFINSGKFTPKFKKQFKLEKAAELDGDNVLAAVYRTDKNVDVYSLVESLEEIVESVDYEILDEIRRRIKINFRGIKRIKMQCAVGFKYDSQRKICVKITGSELTVNRMAHRKASRTKKAKGSGYRRRITFKSKRANKFRKMMGVRNAN